MNKPIFGIALFLILGIIIGRYLALPFFPLYLGLIALFTLAFIFYLKKKERWTDYALFILTLMAGIAYFYYSYYLHFPQHITACAPFPEKVTIIGRVVNHPELKEGRIHFIMEAKKIITEEKKAAQVQEIEEKTFTLAEEGCRAS